MSQPNDNFYPYVMFGLYTVIGAVTRYFITLPCGSKFDYLHIPVGHFAIIFIFIGIGCGLYAFLLRPINRTGQGVVTGLGVGFSGTTAVFLLFPPCT